jgi:hypothetical protein
LQATTARSRRTKSDPQPAAAPQLVRSPAQRAAQPQTGAPGQPGQPAQPGQLLVEDGAAGGAVCIAEQAWAPGLGWYTQRTLSVPDEQLDELIAQLRFARARRRARPAPPDAPRSPAADASVLPFRPRPAGA